MPSTPVRRFRFRPVAAVALAMALMGRTALAKSRVSFVPDLASPSAWNGHALAIVEITITSGGDHSPIKVIEQFSGGDSWIPPVALSRTDTWFPSNDPDFPDAGSGAYPLALKAGDRFLLSQPIEKGPGGLVAAMRNSTVLKALAAVPERTLAVPERLWAVRR